MASFHLIVIARAQIGLLPLPVQPRWAIQSNLAGLEVVMEWFVVVFVHWTNWIRLFRRAYEKLSLVQSVCLSFLAATFFTGEQTKKKLNVSILYIVDLSLPCNSSLRCVRCVMAFLYFTQRTQRKTLRCVRCVVKETAPKSPVWFKLRNIFQFHFSLFFSISVSVSVKPLTFFSNYSC